MAQAFADINILDFTQVLSGPFATFQLALLGAQVIKVEPPNTGDICRPLLDLTNFGGGFMSPMFIGANLNKRSIAVNLKHPEAKGILEPLIMDADVIVENFRPGVMQRLGYDYATINALRPEIVYCSISGYGQAGPSSATPAFDGAIQAASGLMASNGHEATGPTRTVSPVIDVTSGLMAAFAISSALHRRATSGQGQYLDVAMLDSAVTLLNPLFNIYLATGMEPDLLGNQSVTKQPTMNVFPTLDGFIQVTALTPDQVFKFCDELGRADLLADARFATLPARVENRDAMRAEFIVALSKCPCAQWLERLSRVGVPAAPVATLPEVLSAPQLGFRNLTTTLPPHASLGVEQLESVTTGFSANTDGPNAHASAPMLGEHTQDVLLEYGYAQTRIDDWLSNGVVQQS